METTKVEANQSAAPVARSQDVTGWVFTRGVSETDKTPLCRIHFLEKISGDVYRFMVVVQRGIPCPQPFEVTGDWKTFVMAHAAREGSAAKAGE